MPRALSIWPILSPLAAKKRKPPFAVKFPISHSRTHSEKSDPLMLPRYPHFADYTLLSVHTSTFATVSVDWSREFARGEMGMGTRSHAGGLSRGVGRRRAGKRRCLDRQFRSPDRLSRSPYRMLPSRHKAPRRAVNEVPQPVQDVPQPEPDVPAAAPSSAGYGLEAESLPGELSEDIAGATERAQAGPDPGLAGADPHGHSRSGELTRQTAVSGHSAGSKEGTRVPPVATACSPSSPGRTASATSSCSTRSAL